MAGHTGAADRHRGVEEDERVMDMKRIDRKLNEAAREYRMFKLTHDIMEDGYCENVEVFAREWRLWCDLKDAIRNPRGQR